MMNSSPPSLLPVLLAWERLPADASGSGIYRLPSICIELSALQTLDGSMTDCHPVVLLGDVGEHIGQYTDSERNL